MSRAMVIARRELSGYFHAPIGYVAMTLFLAVSAIIFMDDFMPGKTAAMRGIFEWMVWVLVIVVPLLSMGLLSQEWSTGTIESLMTAPVNETDVVAGKFFGSLAFFLVMLAPTALYALVLRIYSEPDFGPILSGYLGIVLVGALFLAVGLFCSSLTRSQMVAAVTAAAILFLVTIVPWWLAGQTAMPPLWRRIVEQSVFHRYTDFSKGVIDTGNLVFFLAGTAVLLFLTVKVLESRRWK